MIKDYKNLDSDELNKLMEFIIKINIEDINQVIDNMSIIINEEVDGIISYENFGNASLVRYFIYKKKVTQNEAKELLLHSIENIKKEYQKNVIIIADEDYLNLLMSLDFEKKEMIYIDEERIITPGHLNVMVKNFV